MFEVGKLSDESLDSFLNELEKVFQHLYATNYFYEKKNISTNRT